MKSHLHDRLVMTFAVGLALAASGCAQTAQNNAAPPAAPVVSSASPAPAGTATAAATTPATVSDTTSTATGTTTAAAASTTPPAPANKHPFGSYFNAPTPSKAPYPNINTPLNEPPGKLLTADERAKEIADLKSQGDAIAKKGPAPAADKKVASAKANDKCKKTDTGALPAGCKEPAK